MNEIIIKSSDTSAQLVFSNIKGDYFWVSYQSPNLTVSKKVWGYTDCEFLVNLFDYMAKKWRGWEGEKGWESIEGEFGISCSSDKKGHIKINLSFVEHEGAEPWQANPILNTEAGLIEGIAKDVRKFFLS